MVPIFLKCCNSLGLSFTCSFGPFLECAIFQASSLHLYLFISVFMIVYFGWFLSGSQFMLQVNCLEIEPFRKGKSNLYLNPHSQQISTFICIYFVNIASELACNQKEHVIRKLPFFSSQEFGINTVHAIQNKTGQPNYSHSIRVYTNATFMFNVKCYFDFSLNFYGDMILKGQLTHFFY